MQVERKDGSRERRILTGMIVDKTVLGRIATKWEPEMFASKWSNLVGSWCVAYFDKYNKPPGHLIEGLFERWANKAKDKESIELVEQFLSGLSGDYKALRKGINPQYLIDSAGEHFSQVKLKRLSKAIDDDLEDGRLEDAHNRVHTFGKVDLGVGQGINVLADREAIRQAFSDKAEALVKYTGALGRFFGDSFARDSFVAFMGPEKRGKTFWLLDVAWHAMLARRRVAFFEVGDMSQNQIMRRFMVRASRRPLGTKEFVYPKFLSRNPDSPYAEVDLATHKFGKALDWREALRKCQRVMKSDLKTKQELLRLSVHPNSSLSVTGLRSVLQTWERDEWVPDMIVIDYADILAPPTGIKESRDQINATWRQLRALSQENHCCVVTATQTNAASYKADRITRSNFSEDKRKLAEVTGMIAINQTPDEKRQGLMRLEWVAQRDEDDMKPVHVAGCLALANPAIRSVF